ncbi:MAG: glycosyltransferase family 4 protein, partial [Candidatus Rokuibacteriota bacterium]
MAPWVAGPAALLIVALLTPVVIRVSRRLGWVAQPTDERWHRRPTALMGGVAIFVGLLGATALFAPDAALWPVWAGCGLMFATGLVDDRRGVRPAAKLVLQIVGAVLFLAATDILGSGWPWFFVPFAVLWVVGITNAVNLLDNMDGLAAGVVGIAASFLAAFSALEGYDPGVVGALSLAGAAFGFLLFNFQPARIFMGDCGSLPLGYGVATLAILVNARTTGLGDFSVYVVSAMVLAVPIFDTTLVTFVRAAAGRSLARGGRDHSSHRLVLLGLSERQATLTLYGIS